MYSSSSLFGFALSLFCPMKDLGGFFSSLFDLWFLFNSFCDGFFSSIFLFSFVFPLFFSNKDLGSFFDSWYSFNSSCDGFHSSSSFFDFVLCLFWGVLFLLFSFFSNNLGIFFSNSAKALPKSWKILDLGFNFLFFLSFSWKISVSPLLGVIPLGNGICSQFILNLYPYPFLSLK